MSQAQDSDPPNTAAPAPEGVVLGEVSATENMTSVEEIPEAFPPTSRSTSDESLVGDAGGGSGGSGGGGAVSLTPLHAQILDDINNLPPPKSLTPEIIAKINQYDASMARALLDLEQARIAGTPLPATFQSDYVDQLRKLQDAIQPPATNNGKTLYDRLEMSRFIAQQMPGGTLTAAYSGQLRDKASAAPARPVTPTSPAAPLTTVPGAATVTASHTVAPAPNDAEIEQTSKSKKPKKPFAPKPLNIFTDSMGNPLTTIGAVLAQMPNLMLVSMFYHAFVVRPVSILSAFVLGSGATILGVLAKGIGLLGDENSYFNKVGDKLLAYGKSKDRTLFAVVHLGGTVFSLGGLIFAYPINAVRDLVFRKTRAEQRSRLESTIDADPEYKKAKESIEQAYAGKTDPADLSAKNKELASAKNRRINQLLYPNTTRLQGFLKYNSTELYGDSFNNVVNNAICSFMPMHVRNGIALGVELALGVAALPFALITGSITALGNTFPKTLGGPFDNFNENVAGPINGFLINRIMGALCRIGEIVGNPIVGLLPSALGDGARSFMGDTFYKDHKEAYETNIVAHILFGFEEGQALTDKIMRYSPDKYALIKTLEHTPNRMVNLVLSPVFIPLGVFSYGINLGLRFAKNYLGAKGQRLDDAIEFSYNLAGSLTVDTVSGVILGKTKSRQFDLGERVSEMGNLAKSMLSNGAEGTDTMLRNANAHLITGDTNPAAPAPVLSVPASSSSTTPTHVPGSSPRVEDAVSAAANLGATQTNQGDAIQAGVVQGAPVPSVPAVAAVQARLQTIPQREASQSFRSDTALRADNVRKSFAANFGGMALRAITLTGTRRALGLTPALKNEPSVPFSFAPNPNQVAPAETAPSNRTSSSNPT